MRKTLTVLLLVLFGLSPFFINAQDTPVSPTMVGVGVYHGLSQPLRDLPAITADDYRKMQLEADMPRNEDLNYREFPFAQTALPIGNDPAWQKEMGSTASSKAPIVTFDGQTSPYYPPDDNGVAGPNHYMQTINSVYAIYTKTGTLVAGPTNLNLLFSGVTGATCNDGDPIILYDEQADRWMVAEFSICGANDYMLVAVSQTNDPTGAWHKYSFDVADMPDYEKFGIWQDGYYMATNNSAGKDIYVFERSKMLIGGTAQMVGFDNPYRPSTIDGFVCVPPVDNDGAFAPAGSPGLFVAFNDDAIGGGSDQLWIYELAVNWTTPTSSTFGRTQQLSVASFDSNFGANWDNIKQLGTTRELDAIPMVVMNAPQYRNFGTYQTLVLCHTVDVDNTDHAGIRWYELRKTASTWSVRQQGTYAPDAHSRWMGSINLNGFGEIGLGYSISSSTLNPGIRYCGQSSTAYTAGSGILDVTEQVITAGAYSQTAYNRWGDYSSICVDPTNDQTFWYTNQYIGTSSARKTRVASFQIGTAPTAPDLIVQTTGASPASILPGATTTASCSVKNQGTASAGASVLKYYLSANSTYEASDVLLGSSNVATLAAGASAAASSLVTIPASTAAGTWYIVFYADADLAVAESNETNNVGNFQITVTAAPQPDLVVSTPAASPSTVLAGQTSTASCSVINQGTASAGASVLKYYLSANSSYEATDILLGSGNIVALAAGASAAASSDVIIPGATAAGTWYILFYADADLVVAENNEANNVGNFQITVTASPQPDLVVLTPAASPSTVLAGQTSTASCSVMNQGTASAGASVLKYFLSANSTYEAADALLASSNVAELASGASVAASSLVTIPASTASGTWYVLFYADADLAVAEGNENNNVGFVAITVQNTSQGCNSTTQYPSSTLTPTTSWKFQNSIYAGEYTAFNVVSGNQYFWSYCTADGGSATYDSEITLRNKADDSFIAYSNDDCGDDAKITWTATFTGVVKVVTTKFSCTTNSVSTKLAYKMVSNAKPDLIVLTPTASPSILTPGQTSTASCTVKNQGTASAGASVLKYFLSANNTYEVTDLLLTSSNVATLAASASVAASGVVTIPASTATGTWYILFFADANLAVTESDETNNVGTVTITLQASIPGCNSTTQYPTTTLTPTTSWKFQNYIYAGEYTAFSVTSGSQYVWSYCTTDGGSATYDSEITLRNKANDAFIAYSNDDCGDDAKITWTATFTGTVKVVTTKYNCATNSVNTKLAYKKLAKEGEYPANEMVADEFSVYPNPTSANVSIGSSTNFEGINEILLYNLNGKLLKKVSLDEKSDSVIEVDLSAMKSGVYYFKLVGDKFTKELKVVVSH